MILIVNVLSSIVSVTYINIVSYPGFALGNDSGLIENYGWHICHLSVVRHVDNSYLYGIHAYGCCSNGNAPVPLYGNLFFLSCFDERKIAISLAMFLIYDASCLCILKSCEAMRLCDSVGERVDL